MTFNEIGPSSIHISGLSRWFSASWALKLGLHSQVFIPSGRVEVPNKVVFVVARLAKFIPILTQGLGNVA